MKWLVSVVFSFIIRIAECTGLRKSEQQRLLEEEKNRHMIFHLMAEMGSSSISFHTLHHLHHRELTWEEEQEITEVDIIPWHQNQRGRHDTTEE